MKFKAWADEYDPSRDKVLSGCLIVILAFLIAILIFVYAAYRYLVTEESSPNHLETPGVQAGASP